MLDLPTLSHEQRVSELAHEIYKAWMKDERWIGHLPFFWAEVAARAVLK